MFLSKVKAREGELPAAFTFLSLSVCVKSTILTINLDIVHLSFAIYMEICLVFSLHLIFSFFLLKPLCFLYNDLIQLSTLATCRRK